MIQIPGYAIARTIRETSHATLVRGTRLVDGAPVVIKLLSGEFPSRTAVGRLRQEHAILEALDIPTVAKAYALERVGNGLGLVLEDAGERSLDTLVGAAHLDMRSFLELARSLASVVESIHRLDVLHRDLKPQHFFLSEDGRQVKLIDFGIATRLSYEAQHSTPPDMLEGTLAYMSPEQTGRMNRTIDRRSDLYSLGVVFYELVTGVLPFSETDALELVHSHITRVPRAPHEVVATVPPMVSAIIMRLLAKVAEQRYQSAAGLKADLTRCIDAMAATGVVPMFSIGSCDVPERLTIPQKLYGRQVESAALMAAFERARAGAAELLLVAGGSGIGKSALVHELHAHLVNQGSFVAGKFDQLNRNVPYAPIVQAYRELVRMVLTESTSGLAAWRTALVEALGPNGKLMTDLIPELALVIGPQPPVPQLGPSESQNRFELALQNFLQVFTSAKHTLVIALDDLQWADAASLRLIHLMLTAGGGHLLVIGTYRDNEVGAVHPLSLALQDLRNAGATTNEITLAPLGLADVRTLVRETLRTDAPDVDVLVEVALRKTRGNPFFLNQFLMTLDREGLMCFHAETRKWTWDLERIESEVVTDNVVEFMVAQLQRLPAETRDMLQLAACVGHQFDRSALAVLAEQPPSAVSTHLYDALREGMVVRLDGARAGADGDDENENDATYRFLHDRVQQAAYSLIAESDKAAAHLRIGRLMRDSAGTIKDEDVFDVVGHLNRGVALMTVDERRSLVRLNLKAGTKARDAAAHRTAIDLLTKCLALAGDDAWTTDYDVAYPATLAKAECAFVCGDLDEAFRLLDVVDARAATTFERVPACVLRITILTNMSRVLDAAACGAAAARMQGAALPTDPAAIGAAIGEKFGAVMAALGGRPYEVLLDLPAMECPHKLALVQTLFTSIPSTYQTSQDMAALMILEATSLALEHGNSPLSSYFHVMFGIVVAVATKDVDARYRLGRVGIELNERLGVGAVEGASRFVFGALVSHWSRPYAESLDSFRRSLKASLDVGDFIHAGYSSALAVFHRFARGEDLGELSTDIEDFVDLLGRTGDVINRGSVLLASQAIASLQGATSSPTDLGGARLDEATYVRDITQNVMQQFMYAVVKMTVQYFAGDFEGAVAMAKEAAPLVPAANGFLHIAEHAFYQALSRAGVLRSRSMEDTEREATIEALRQDVEMIREWALSAPDNHAHQHALVQGELAAATGAAAEAMDAYERAIRLAQDNGFIHHQAIANERCADLHLAAGRTKVAAVYMTDAYHAYTRWGAVRKAQAIAAAYPTLVRATPDHVPASSVGRATTVTTATTSLGHLDVATAIRATQAISSELVLDRLLERLMCIVVENAAAQRGLLVLERDHVLRVSATVEPGRVDVCSSELGSRSDLATTVVQYVARTREVVVLADAGRERRFANDPYLAAKRAKSLLCVPMLHQGRLTGVLYLEHNGATDVFSPARLELIQFLAAQAAIAVENAELYGDLHEATDELRRANDTLEQRVADRTSELAKRNGDMRVVLDNVVEGLVTIDLEGRLLEERSAIVDRWFGPNGDGRTLHEYLGAFDPQFGSMLAVGLDQIRADFLPLEVCLEQMPARLRAKERDFACKYLPIMGRTGTLEYLLVVIEDVTDLLLRARKDAEQRDLMATVTAIMRDRQPFLGFFEEATRMMVRLSSSEPDLVEQKRLVHTLKGNASMFALEDFARMCHAVEDDIATEGELRPATLAPLSARWTTLAEAVGTLVGTHEAHAVHASIDDARTLMRDIASGLDRTAISARIEAWTSEPADRQIRRLGQYAATHAGRLGKGNIEIDICATDLRLDPERFAPLWSALVHVVRNAVDHGLEHPEDRQSAGKAPHGRLRLAAEIRGCDVVIDIEDDGRGVDWSAIERIAAERGLPCATRADLVEAMLRPDFSTRKEVTTSSGRGVGMAEVAERVRAFGGTLLVESEPHVGTRWRVTVPTPQRRRVVTARISVAG
jgi:predicted ATPase/GAF domain-containing protein/signal transduction histidine kinase